LNLINNWFQTDANGPASDDEIGQMIMLRHCGGAINIIGNVFANTGENNYYAMLNLARPDENPTARTINFYNNTVIETKTTDEDAWNVMLVFEATAAGDVANVKNNIFYTAYLDQQRVIWHWGSGAFNHDYNTFYGATGNQAYNNTTCSNYVSTSTNEYCATNPLFLNFGSNDFRIDSQSPAHDAGVDLGSSYNTALSTSTPTFPNSLITRPQPPGGAWDIGAYEVAAGGDTCPDQFTLYDVTDAVTYTWYTSTSPGEVVGFDVSGIDVATSISISGNGKYSINSADWTNDNGTVNNNDHVDVGQYSSASWETPVNTTLYIGDSCVKQDTMYVTTSTAPAGAGQGFKGALSGTMR
jgi:hypothetical protein